MEEEEENLEAKFIKIVEDNLQEEISEKAAEANNDQDVTASRDVSLLNSCHTKAK